MIDKHIEIVRTNIPILSSMKQQSAEKIKHVLLKKYQNVGISIINDKSDLDDLIKRKPDLVFLGLKKIQSPLGLKDTFIWMGDYLDKAKINFTGSDSKAIRLEYNKPKAKIKVKDYGVATTDYFMVRDQQFNANSKLPINYPLFLKPHNTGGGRGIGSDSVVRNFTDFSNKVISITRKYQSEVIAEKYLNGREFSVAIMGKYNSNNLLAMPLEIISPVNLNGDRVLSKSIKKADSETTIIINDLKLKKAINKMAISSFNALGGRDYGRIDIRLDEKGIPNFIEANLIPGITINSSYFSRSCNLVGSMNYEEMIFNIVELSFARINI